MLRMHQKTYLSHRNYSVPHPRYSFSFQICDYDRDMCISACLLGDVCDGVPLRLGEVGDTTEHVGAVCELCCSQSL